MVVDHNLGNHLALQGGDFHDLILPYLEIGARARRDGIGTRGFVEAHFEAFNAAPEVACAIFGMGVGLPIDG